MKLPFDEINDLVRKTYPNVESIQDKPKEEIIDSLFDLLLMALVMGYGEGLSTDTVREEIYMEIDGKTWVDRAEDHIDKGKVGEIYTLMETESHRLYNTGTLIKAKEDGYLKKTWKTALDDRVRDTHEPLENITLDIDSLFITWDGDQAKAPGGFVGAENNCNCRCYLEYS